MLLLYHTSRRTEGADVPLLEREGCASELVDGREGERKGGGIPNHHKARKIRHLQSRLDINTHINNKPNKRKQKPRRSKRKPQPRQIARERQNQQHHCPRHIRRHGIQIRFDSTIPQPRNNLRQIQLHTLQRHAQTDLNPQNHPTRAILKNPERIPQHKFHINNRTRVALHAIIRQSLFFWGEELRVGGAVWEVPEGEEGKEDGAGAFDDEEVGPVDEGAGADLEDAEGEEAGEGGGDGLGGVEDCEAAGEFAAAVESVEKRKIVRDTFLLLSGRDLGGRMGIVENLRGLIINHQREKCTLRQSQKPSQSQQATEILHSRDQKRKTPKTKHH